MVVYSWYPTRFIGQHRPILVGEFVTHDSKPLIWDLESQAPD